MVYGGLTACLESGAVKTTSLDLAKRLMHDLKTERGIIIPDEVAPLIAELIDHQVRYALKAAAQGDSNG